MVDTDAIAALITPDAEALGFELVRVRWFAGDDATLQIMAERPETGQLNIDDCAELSRRISERFDALEAEGMIPSPKPIGSKSPRPALIVRSRGPRILPTGPAMRLASHSRKSAMAASVSTACWPASTAMLCA